MKPERRINLFEERLTHSIIGGFYEVYNYYGFGLSEKVYANALEIELKAAGTKSIVRYGSSSTTRAHRSRGSAST